MKNKSMLIAYMFQWSKHIYRAFHHTDEPDILLTDIHKFLATRTHHFECNQRNSQYFTSRHWKKISGDILTR